MNIKTFIFNKIAVSSVLLYAAVGSSLAGTTAYIPGGGGMASVIDTTTQTQTSVISGLGTNFSLSLSPNGSVAYSADYSGNSVRPINTSTNVAGTAIPVGVGPVNVTFSADSSTAYVSNLDGNSISVINVSTGTVTSTVTGVCSAGSTFGPTQSVFNGPKLLIVCRGSPSTVMSMDTSAANALTSLATVQDDAYNIAISTSSGFGYVTNFSSGTVSKFNLTSGAATHYPTTGVTLPLGLAVTPDGSKIYVGDLGGGSNLIVMNPSGTVLSTLDLGVSGIAGLGMSSNGTVMYAPLGGTAAGIKVIDTATDSVTATIANPGASVSIIWGDFLGNVSASASPNSAPTATSVSISGTAQSGSTLTGSYTYTDADSDAQGSSTFRWVKNSVNTGVGGGTNVGTSTTYTPVAGDVGSFMYYCVTPVAAAGVTTGTEVCSVATSAVISGNAAPVATSVAISGTSQATITLTGSYTYTDADSDAQGSSTFRWVKNSVNTGVGGGTNVGTSTTYTPVAGDVGSYLYYCVTPVASAGVTTGTEVCSVASAAVAAAPVPAPIPTLSEWAMILMASLMGLFAFTRIRRQS